MATVEHELKLRGGADVLSRLEGEPLEERRFTSTYYGTAEHRLARSDVSLHDVAARDFRKLKRMARRLPPEAGDEELHRPRIKGKRARYAAELAEEAVGKPATRFIERAKRFQDVIGEHQDAVVAEERLRELRRTSRGASTSLLLGRLVERQHRQERARAQLPRSWKNLERSGRKAWF